MPCSRPARARRDRLAGCELRERTGYHLEGRLVEYSRGYVDPAVSNLVIVIGTRGRSLCHCHFRNTMSVERLTLVESAGAHDVGMLLGGSFEYSRFILCLCIAVDVPQLASACHE